MSSRPGFIVDHFLPVPEYEGKSPNKYVGTVTAHFRVYWPPLAPKELVRAQITEAYLKALEELERMRESEVPTSPE